MAECANAFGVKNILMTFIDCNTGRTVGPISHSHFGDAMPMWRLVRHKNQQLPGKSGRVKQTPTPMQCEIEVEVDHRIPLRYYQGDAMFNPVQVELLDGRVFTAIKAIPMGEDKSDANSVKLQLEADTIDELLFETALL